MEYTKTNPRNSRVLVIFTSSNQGYGGKNQVATNLSATAWEEEKSIGAQNEYPSEKERAGISGFYVTSDEIKRGFKKGNGVMSEAWFREIAAKMRQRI